MKKRVGFCFILFLILFGCSSQQSLLEKGPGKGDAFIWLSRVAEETVDQSESADKGDIAAMTTLFDSLCVVPNDFSADANFVKLQKQLEKIAQWDEMIERLAAERREPHLFVAAKELEFKVFTGTQAQMESLFNAPERHGGFVFDKKVSMMLPYIQTNKKFSQAKTAVLMDVIEKMFRLETRDEKKRGWQAIERMTKHIDIPKSESGYEPFQRSAQGIYLQQGELLGHLDRLRQNETNLEIRHRADRVVEALIEKFKQSRDPEFWQRVEESKELQRLIQEHDFSLSGNNTAKVTPDNAQSAEEWFHLGVNASDHTEQITYYSRAIELDSAFARAYNNRGNIYQKQNKLHKALGDFVKATTLNPGSAHAWINRAHICQALDEHEEALKHYSKAIELNPGQTELYASRALCFTRLRDYENALKEYDRAIERNPQNAALFSQRGSVYSAMDGFRRAEKDYTRAIELAPSNATLYNKRGIVLNQLQHYDLAIQDYQNAIAHRPDYALAYFNMGIAYWQQAEWEKVIEAWEGCLRIDPDNASAKEWLSRARKVSKPRTITIERRVTIHE